MSGEGPADARWRAAARSRARTGGARVAGPGGAGPDGGRAGAGRAAAGPAAAGGRADSGNAKAFEGLNDLARGQCLKIVALFQGPEFRRAALNPLAAVAALNRVIASGGQLGIADAVYKSTLFGPKE
ncbi:hypothetical protein [Kitasatospora mediocidica]|uniref:hypothetical protein n=1 Tax=Kitasatospora mediocidica TaxID=58352 RepID=UPI000564F05D|nr:hypothetical protein [Kitasatospora mediocidica]